MREIEEKIKNIFLMPNGKVMPIAFNNCTSYLISDKTSYHVAIPYKFDKQIHEEFVGMSIYSSYVNFDNNSVPSLVLTAPHTVDIDKLVLIASDFISEENRAIISNDPYIWVDKWKELFGDSIKKKMVYDIIAEMLALKTFYYKDKSLKWVGQDKGTHDIVGENIIYEVKSTIKKTENNVGIHSSYQLSTEKPTKLIFIRLEKKPHSLLSINSLLSELVNLGYSESELENALEANRYNKGNRSREETYDLLSMYAYDVNKENFPIISLEDINEFAPYKNILGFELKIDLTLINKDVLFEKE